MEMSIARYQSEINVEDDIVEMEDENENDKDYDIDNEMSPYLKTMPRTK